MFDKNICFVSSNQIGFVNVAISSIYQNTNEKIEKMSTMLFFIFKNCGFFYATLPITTSTFNYISSRFSNEYFQQIHHEAYVIYCLSYNDI